MKKVLIVEDDEMIQGLEARKIKNSGFEISSAQTGKEALIKILEPNLDIIILDLTLPDISGLDILKKIRETETTKNIPVIVFSNVTDDENTNKAIGLGANKFMIKSNSSLEELIIEINNLL